MPYIDKIKKTDRNIVKYKEYGCRRSGCGVQTCREYGYSSRSLLPCGISVNIAYSSYSFISHYYISCYMLENLKSAVSPVHHSSHSAY